MSCFIDDSKNEPVPLTDLSDFALDYVSDLLALCSMILATVYYHQAIRHFAATHANGAIHYDTLNYMS